MKNELLPALTALALAGCATSSTLVIEHPQPLAYETGAVSASFTIRSTPIAEVPEEHVAAFEYRLRTELERAGINELTIEYHFVRSGADGQLDRWFVSGAGGRSVTVDVVFKNVLGQRLARIQVEVRTRPGFFGGSLQHALNLAADDIASFAIESFDR